MKKDVKIRRCEVEKMIYKPPLLEEPFAQTLSGKNDKVTFENNRHGEFHTLRAPQIHGL